MLQAHIQIDKKLAIKAYKRALHPVAIKNFSATYGSLMFSAWLVVAVVDFFTNQEALISYHTAFLFGLWVLEIAVATVYWHRTLARTTQGWGFYAKLDNEGVTTQYDEAKHAWHDYSAYIEYAEYLQIIDSTGNISFLPKNEALAEIVAFTKTKIPRKS